MNQTSEESRLHASAERELEGLRERLSGERARRRAELEQEHEREIQERREQQEREREEVREADSPCSPCSLLLCSATAESI